MTRKLFLDAVKSHGLEAVSAEQGSEFNPEMHEAVGTVEESEIADNCVVNMTQRGYILKGRLIRPAKVTVSKV
jgi:molecular chaperone GrpE